MKTLKAWAKALRIKRLEPHSAEEAERILSEQTQLDENAIDGDLVLACLRVLQPNVLANPPHKEEVYARIMQSRGVPNSGELPSKKKAKRWNLRLTPAILSIAVFVAVVIPLGSHILFGNQNLLSGQTMKEDEETFLIEGRASRGDLIPPGEASTNGSQSKIETKDLAQIENLTSLNLAVPTWLPEGWTLKRYSYERTKMVEDFMCVYENPTWEKLVLYNISKVKKPEIEQTQIEQNGPGEDIILENGLSAYVGQNMNTFFCVWVADNCVHYVTTPTSQEDLLSIVNSLERVY